MQNLTIDSGTQKRKHLTSLVRKTARKRDWLRLKFEWDTELHNDRLSCCTVVFRGKGNIFSLYTWTKKRRVKNFPLPRFDSVEVSLFDRKYEKLAYEFCAELSGKGYEVGMTMDYAAKKEKFEIYRD